jgi:hypothetical protein
MDPPNQLPLPTAQRRWLRSPQSNVLKRAKAIRRCKRVHVCKGTQNDGYVFQ